MFNTFKELKSLNKKNVLKSLYKKGYNEVDLCKNYIKGFKQIGIPVNSDLRTNDNNASLHVKIKFGKVIISDFGYKTGMDIFDYIQTKYFTENKVGYLKTLDLIVKDYRLDDIRSYYNSDYKSNFTSIPIKHNTTVKETLPILINIKSRSWTDADFKYWKQYNLTPQDFKNSNIIIKPLEKFRIINLTKETSSEVFLEQNLSYAYCFYYQGNWQYKIYSPYGIDGKGTMKWVSNTVNDYIIGMKKIIDPNLLVIQSSFKDKVLMDKMGYYTLPLMSESTWFSPKHWNKLKSTFNNIVYFANNDWEKEDNPGLTLAKRHMESYGIKKIITTPNIKEVTDISDYTKKYGYSRASLFVKMSLNK